MAALSSHVRSVSGLVAQAQAGLFSHAYTDAEVEAFESGVLEQSWMMTVALVTNVGNNFSCREVTAHPSLIHMRATFQLAIGDSIVWWRVCALSAAWRHRIVYCTGPLLIVLTSGTFLHVPHPVQVGPQSIEAT